MVDVCVCWFRVYCVEVSSEDTLILYNESIPTDFGPIKASVGLFAFFLLYCFPRVFGSDFWNTNAA